MYCTRCGKEVKDGAKFCPNCGAKIESGESVNRVNFSETQGHQKKQKKSGPKIAIIIAAVLIVCAGGGVAYSTVGLSAQKDKLVKKIEKSGVTAYAERGKDYQTEWKTYGIFDVSDKKETISDLKKLADKAEKFTGYASEVKQMEKEKDQYDLDEESFSAYEEVLQICSDAIDDEDTENIADYMQEAKTALKELKAADDDYIAERVETYQNVDMSEAEEKEVNTYKKDLDEIQKLVKADKMDYKAVKEAFAKMDEAIFMYLDPKNPIQIMVQQVDASEFPKVKLYLSMKDLATGEVPENLESNLFYIRKEDANADYVKQKVTSVKQLNETEALKVDMVADVSGSMEGTPLQEAQSVMSDFIDSMQFDTGDKVELTSFATGVRLEQEFTDDSVELKNDIYSLTTGNMTSLYDALYTSVERAATQTGARCVIAFTDGDDNYSNCTAEDVVNVANRYHIPVFIIGIGYTDYSNVSYIAAQTGGAYYNISDVNSMKSIYEEIYKMEKELYLVEFEDTTGATVSDTANIVAGYHSAAYGGECQYTYTPNVLLSAKSADIYKDGPQAVVEGYLKNFDDAMNQSDFSLISGYLKQGSDIYTEQEQYVLRDISEQLDSYEITDVSYGDADHCIVSTRETYYVQIKGKSLQLMTQECRYIAENDGGKWLMTGFDDIKVVSRINQ